MSTEMPQPTRDELAGLYGEHLVELCEGFAEDGFDRDPYGFGRDITLWERVFLENGGIFAEWRTAYARATARGECPLFELPDWVLEHWNADEICYEFPCPTCPTSPFEEITGMTPEEYLERERERSLSEESDDEIPF